jgi:four helix bundle protein
VRDHRKLRAFELADELAVRVYQVTAHFPADERFGLTAQMRRAAVSIPSNIVEGCARHSKRDYLRFLDIAYGSACELQYQATLARRLGLMTVDQANSIGEAGAETARVLNGLIGALRRRNLTP